MATFPSINYVDVSEYLTKEEYLRGLKDVLASAVSDGPTVVHGHGATAFVPDGRPTFHVFVEMALDGRVRKAQLEDELRPEDAHKILTRADKAFATLHKSLYGIDPLDPYQYDVRINMDRLTVEGAARIVSGAVVRSTTTQKAQRRSLQTA